MIVIPAIFKDGSARPESIPDLKFGNYFDGASYNYFESKQEVEAWKLAQENQQQIPVEDEFFKEGNIVVLWEKLIQHMDKLPVELLDELAKKIPEKKQANPK